MAAHKKQVIPKSCQKCGKPFNSPLRSQALCKKCESALPKCGICHTVMAKEDGYMEGFARKVGKYKICDCCNAELKAKGFLHISESQYLLPSGRVKVKAVPAEDKV